MPTFNKTLLNDEKVTVTITLHGEHAKKLLEACSRSNRSRRSEVTTRIEDHLIKNRNFIAS